MPFIVEMTTNAPHFIIGDMSDFEKKVPDMRRRADISGVFRNDGQLLDPEETPEHLVLHRRGKAPPRDIFKTHGGAMVASDRLRLLMEEMDPGCHQFLPISIDNRPEFEPRYILNVHATKDTIIDDQSDVKPSWHTTGREKMHFTFPAHLKGPVQIAFSPAAMNGPHVWRERRYASSLIISDAFEAALREGKLAFFPLRKAQGN